MGRVRFGVGWGDGKLMSSMISRALLSMDHTVCMHEATNWRMYCARNARAVLLSAVLLLGMAGVRNTRVPCCAAQQGKAVPDIVPW